MFRSLISGPADRLHDMAIDCGHPQAKAKLTALHKRADAVETAEDLLILIAFANAAQYDSDLREHWDAQLISDFVDDCLSAVANAAQPCG